MIILFCFAGESYIDCCKRILPILEKMERSTEHLLIVAHQAILRCIVTYLLQGDLRKLPTTKIPQHCLIRVTWLNGENIIDYIRTPIDHSEQGIVKSVLEDSAVLPPKGASSEKIGDSQTKSQQCQNKSALHCESSGIIQQIQRRSTIFTKKKSSCV